MKKFLQTALLAFSLGFMVACSSDDPEPPHIVGDWTLEALNGVNFPDTYSAWETIGYNSPGYDLEINEDGTFVERFKQINAPSLVVSGSWDLTDDDLTLDYDDSEDNSNYKVVRNELDQLWFTLEYGDFFISNDNLQKLETEFGTISKGFEYLDTMDSNIPEEKIIIDEYFQLVNFDLLYSLVRAE